ncbi:putative cytochrome P450 [Ktedonobacter sp. SOSP1-52]|uniref:cytochrome P450 n=1 Tax=Ktedonobacter sp. SOSP1-52 TaxID=2778366 RepID=UPI001915C0C2|nr:cytochrome P450 [Ktedonobacter sp. SOSP1-52]GHO70596.1 putative cytochrome P450 [Ktedonobacter sp. SOSP1-52]
MTTSEIRPYEAIPQVEFPQDFYMQVGPLLASYYEQYGPIFRAERFGRQITYMLGPEANRFILVNNRKKFSHHIGWSSIFQVEQLLGRGLLMMDGEEHAHHRKIMNPAFTIGYMSRYLPLMQRIIREQAESWLERGEVDIYEEMRTITFNVAAEALTGLKSGAEVDTFRHLFVSLLNPAGPFESDEEYYAYITPLQAQLRELLLPRIEERRKQPTDDVFGLLVRAHDEHGQSLSDEQLISHINILLVAGHETSTSLSAWLLYLLSQHPDYTQRILQEQTQLLAPGSEPTLEEVKKMKVLDNALSEAERLYPPVANGPRGVAEDFEFHGYHVPAGTFVFYSIAGAHRLPSIFKDPENFDPDRFAPPREEQKKSPYALVGFGGGPRICIGINFAQVEIKAIASHILRNYRLTLAPNQHIQQVYGVTGFPLNGIRMRFNRA